MLWNPPANDTKIINAVANGHWYHSIRLLNSCTLISNKIECIGYIGECEAFIESCFKEDYGKWYLYTEILQHLCI